MTHASTIVCAVRCPTHKNSVDKGAMTRKALDRDEQIVSLKKQLLELESRSQQKQLALMRKNEMMAARDEARHEQFLREYKTPEQLAAEAAAMEVQRIQGLLNRLMESEDDGRSSLEEEEGVEYRLMLQENRLRFNCITLSAVYAEYEKQEFQKALRREELARIQASYEKLKLTLASTETESRRQLERVHTNEWRVLENLKKSDHARCTAELQRREAEQLQAELAEIAKRAQAVADNGQQILEAEEDALQAEIRSRIERIETGFRRLSLASA